MNRAWVEMRRHTRVVAAALALAAAVALCAGLGVAVAAARTAPAAAGQEYVFWVDSTADDSDKTVADGRCLTEAGACTLRAALEQAVLPEGVIFQAHGMSANDVTVTIGFNLSLPATITLGKPLSVAQNVNIRGPVGGELRIDGQHATHHFDIGGLNSGAFTISMSDLSLINGSSGSDGGSVNLSPSPFPSDVSFERVIFDGNQALKGLGGAIANQGHRVRVIDSRFTQNTADQGGAAANIGGSLQVSRSSLYGNRAGNVGGALLNIDGPGVFDDGAFIVEPSEGVMTVTVSTLADNDAYWEGGAIHNEIRYDHGVATWVRGSTIVRNVAEIDGGGGIYNGWASNLVLNTSILAANVLGIVEPLSDDCVSASEPPVFGFAPAAPSGFLTGGDNLMGAGASTNCPTSPSDTLYDPGRIFTDVLDDQLRSYDGSQPMFALLPRSPAIDRTTPGAGLCGTSALNVDQRGAPKPLGPACDIGAYEAALPNIAVGRTVSLSPNACTSNTVLELATGVPVYSCATVVNTGNVAFTRTVFIDRASGRTFRLPRPLPPGQAAVLGSLELQEGNGQPALGDLLLTMAGEGVSQWSTPPGLAPTVAGQGVSSARPLDVGMEMTSRLFGFGAIRTITVTATYHQDGTRVPPHRVMAEITGGTRASPPPQVTSNGVVTFTYISYSPLTVANGLVRGSGARQSLVAQPDAAAAVDTIRVWVDLNGNNVWDSFEPMTLAQAATAIDLASFTAEARPAAGVLLRWRTGSEVDVAGFNLYRAAGDGPYSKINADLIPSTGAGLGSSYEYADHPSGPGTYSYKLEEVTTDGATTLHGPVSIVVPTAEGGHRVLLPMLGR